MSNVIEIKLVNGGIDGPRGLDPVPPPPSGNGGPESIVNPLTRTLAPRDPVASAAKTATEPTPGGSGVPAEPQSEFLNQLNDTLRAAAEVETDALTNRIDQLRMDRDQWTEEFKLRLQRIDQEMALADRRARQEERLLNEQFERAQREREGRLREFRDRQDEIARGLRAESQQRLIGALAITNQAISAINNYINSRIQSDSQRIQGDIQKAEVAETQGTFNAAGNTAAVVGGLVGGVPGAIFGFAIGQAIKEIGDLFTAGARAQIARLEAFEKVGDRLEGFSPELSEAKAKREANQVGLNQRDAQILGPQLAELETAKARLDTINALNALANNVGALSKTIEQTKKETDKQIFLLEYQIAMAEAFGKKVDQRLKDMLEELKKGEKDDTTSLKDLLDAGKFNLGDWATQSPGEDLEMISDLNVPIFDGLAG